MTCPFCSLELGSSEIELNRKWHFDCQRCSLCSNEVTHEIAEQAITAERKPEHSTCREAKLDAELKDGLPLTYEHLNRLNSLMLSRRPENILSLESLYDLLRSMQQCTANVSIAISRQRDKTRIRDAENYRAHVEIETENIRETKRIEETKKLQRQAERLDPRVRDRRKAIEGLMALGMSRETAEGMVPQIKVS